MATERIQSVPEETTLRIESELKEWENADWALRQRFAAAMMKLYAALRPMEKAIVASERLTEKDFAIRINMRDQ